MKRRKYNWSDGSLSSIESEFLRRLTEDAIERHGGPVVEFGTLIGKTTQLLALWCAGRKVFTVDCFRWNPWGMDGETQFNLAKLLLKPWLDGNSVELVKDRKEKFCARNLQLHPALVFIDADHSYPSVARDIAWAKQVDAAVICGHDYGNMPGVTQAVDECGGPKELAGSLWLLR